MKLLRYLLIGSIASMMASYASYAIPRIEITQGQIAPTPISITDFFSADFFDTDTGINIAQVIKADLASSGLFETIDSKAFIQTPEELQKGPRFADWRLLNSHYLLSGKIVNKGGQIAVEFRLYDVFAGAQILGLSLAADKDKWRRMAHMISDAIYKRITGEEGYFNTRVVYIAETKKPGAKHRTKRLAMMDHDGENHQFLTDGRNLVLTPRFSPSNQEIAYLAFINKTAHVYLMDVKSGKQKLLGNFEGMTFAPRFSPDGKSIIMSLAKSGTTALYTMHLPSGKVSRLTNHVSIDTSPCYSPDAQSIAFTSDRSGTPQIYVIG